MKLLFDQNLSPKLVERLADLFSGSEHVLAAGWLLIGNCTTSQVEALLRYRYDDLLAFDSDPTLATILLRP